MYIHLCCCLVKVACESSNEIWASHWLVNDILEKVDAEAPIPYMHTHKTVSYR